MRKVIPGWHHCTIQPPMVCYFNELCYFDKLSQYFSIQRTGYKDCVGILIKHGARVDSQDNDGKTPLATAVSKGLKYTFKYQ